MPNAKQAFGLLIVGGIAALAAGVATSVTKQTNGGAAGFAVTAIGGGLGAFGAVALLSGTGVKLAG